uniref:Uncharacterized protein n=1 Tax=Anguilla anguilla TaxID=7936 RepID=A0A0E9SPT7_ANGAN
MQIKLLCCIRCRKANE